MLPAMSFDSREREKTATFARVGSAIGGSLVGVVAFVGHRPRDDVVAFRIEFAFLQIIGDVDE